MFLFILFHEPHEITTLTFLPCAELSVPFNNSFVLNLFLPSRLLSLYPIPSPLYLFGKLTNILSNLSHTTCVCGLISRGIFFSSGLFTLHFIYIFFLAILYVSPPLSTLGSCTMCGLYRSSINDEPLNVEIIMMKTCLFC